MSALNDFAEDYVLGLLEPDEAARVEARLARLRSQEDKDLAGAIGAARDRLLPLDLTAPELPVSPTLWGRIEAELPSGRVPAIVARGWRHAALGATAATVLMAALLAWQVFQPGPAVLIVLLNDGGEAVAVLEAFADNRVRATPLGGVEAGSSQVLQVSTKPDPDGPPVSVGFLQEVAQAVVRNADLPPPSAGSFTRSPSSRRAGLRPGCRQRRSWASATHSFRLSTKADGPPIFSELAAPRGVSR